MTPTEKLESFHSEFPELYEPLRFDPDWESDVITIPLDNPEGELPEDFLWGSGTDDQSLRGNNPESPPFFDGCLENPLAGAFADLPVFGGSPGMTGKERTPNPPTDALAYYLPHHFFRPHWWGIYLTYEGVAGLGAFLQFYSHGRLSLDDAQLAAQRFLYYHEAWHHNVESFAFRLEASHHERLYVLGFQRHYSETLKEDHCWEEGIANAYAYHHAPDHDRFDESAKDDIRNGLEIFMLGQPPSYQLALEILRDVRRQGATHQLAADLHAACFERHPIPQRALPKKPSVVWEVFTDKFRGLANIRARTHYVIHRQSPLFTRSGIRPIKHALLKQHLRELGCELVRQGSGHEIWQNASGERQPIPRHATEVSKGLERKLLKWAQPGAAASSKAEPTSAAATAVSPGI